MKVPRRFLLSLPLLLPVPAIAQTASTQAARITAGKAAITAANGARWAEADTYAAAADPLVAKIVLWMRLTHRTAPATAAELVGFLRDNPDWPLADTIARRAEAAFGGPADDALVLAHFSTFPPRSLSAALRHAEALTRGTRTQAQSGNFLDMMRRGPDNAPSRAARPSNAVGGNLEGEAGAQQTLRRAWVEAPGDAAAEAAIMSQFGRLLTAEDHSKRFDRLFFARDLQGAQRALERMSGVPRGSGEMRMALAGEPEITQVALRPLDLGWAYERARLLRRRNQDADAVASWIVAEPFQANMDPEIARAVWAERQILARKLLRLNNPKDAHRVAAFHGQPMGSEGRIEAEFLAGFIALRFLNDPVLAQRHFVAIALGSRSVITRARAFYWEGRALAARGAQAAARERYAAAAQLPTAFYGQLAALTMGESQESLDRRLRAADSPLAALAAHPGYAATDLQQVAPRQTGSAFGSAMMTAGNAMFAQSAAAGALPTVQAATDPSAEGGQYWGPRILGWIGAPALSARSGSAKDVALAERLWEVSEARTGCRLGALTR